MFAILDEKRQKTGGELERAPRLLRDTMVLTLPKFKEGRIGLYEVQNHVVEVE